MKKIILILSIALLSATASFAQWNVKVSWNTLSSNCDCNASSGSSFIVYLNIKDVANNNFDEDYAKVVDADEFTYTFYKEIKDDLQAHCDDLNNTFNPNYTLFAYVVFYCADTTPPELLCDGHNSKTNVTCYDFNQGLVTIIEIPLD